MVFSPEAFETELAEIVLATLLIYRANPKVKVLGG